MQVREIYRRDKLAKIIDEVTNNRPIKAVLLAISKGEDVTAEEKARAVKYEREKRKKRFNK